MLPETSPLDEFIAALGKLRLPREFVPIEPNAKQDYFLRRNELEVFFGGAAGPGKSWGLMMAALQWVDSPAYHGLLLRPSATDFEGAKGLIETSTRWLERTKASWNGNRREWTFPSGATIRFGYLKTLADVGRYAGHGYSFLGWDELTLFPENQYRAMMRVVRQDIDTARIGIPIRVRSASNPGNVGHQWVKDRFVDPGTRELGSVYVPATIHDNPDLDYDAYLQTLKHLSPIDQERLVRGDWDVMEKGGKFDRDDFIIIDQDEMPTPIRSVRYWDLAATEPSEENPDPDWTAGVRLDLTREGEFIISDIRAFRCNDAEVEKRIRQVANEDGKRVPIYIEQEPGASGKSLIGHYIRNVLPGFPVHRGLPRLNGRPAAKEVRARPAAAAVSNGIVKIVRGPNTRMFLDQAVLFPNPGVHDDLIDAFAGAHNSLAKQPSTAGARSSVPRGTIPGVDARGRR